MWKRDNAFVVIFFKTMYNKTIIRLGFCDIQNNQGLGKGYQPMPSVDNPPYLGLDYSGYHKNRIQQSYSLLFCKKCERLILICNCGWSFLCNINLWSIL